MNIIKKNNCSYTVMDISKTVLGEMCSKLNYQFSSLQYILLYFLYRLPLSVFYVTSVTIHLV